MPFSKLYKGNIGNITTNDPRNDLALQVEATRAGVTSRTNILAHASCGPFCGQGIEQEVVTMEPLIEKESAVDLEAAKGKGNAGKLT
ncbi:unnamed protein product [Acanthoscelides obtectus]|uniref:Uncharacterized protein n=1 Tax=Acanthoscelides obtectus TaxID=200917 RepID=A0A9P0PJC3_ACAOB|nr:unnamed protein product [Acanthoscelides obtectus]CAK1660434.1 hypothetical protein AOBTE_LOCUS22061 [Acanthoscelides obtectus]